MTRRSTVLDVLAGFVRELRAAGLPVSLTENLDALEAVRHVPLEDRDVFRTALAATMVKSAGHRPAFDTLFDIWFSVAPGLGAGEEDLTDDELTRLLERALQEGEDADLVALARGAVLRFSGIEAGRPMGPNYYLLRTLRALDVEGALERLLATPQDQGDVDIGAGEVSTGSLTALLRRDELARHEERLRHEVEAEIRRLLVAERGAASVTRTVRRPLPEDTEFMHASRDDLVALGKALQPLTRKLSTRLARKRRHRCRGPLDFRSTVRHSLSYGGVPAEPRFRHPRPAKPEIMVIADISGSVAAFARFTLQFVYAMSAQFSKVRAFVFIDGIDEVTQYFENVEDITEAVHRVNTEADVIWVDGHSDYGHAFETFWERWGREITSKTSVILLGDARNNYHASQAWVVSEIRKRARHVYWLNPEPRSYWDTGDSILSEYATHTDGAFECRNLKQLERFVEHLA
ncbi:MAG TPA: VWA domain-containing protein [Acidimicrobiales bacterium]|nr:VWA domain-containing protein [Acidimicrobiales bacterium]